MLAVRGQVLSPACLQRCLATWPLAGTVTTTAHHVIFSTVSRDCLGHHSRVTIALNGDIMQARCHRWPEGKLQNA